MPALQTQVLEVGDLLKPVLQEVQLVGAIEQVAQLMSQGWQYRLAEKDTRMVPVLQLQVPSPLGDEPVAQILQAVALVQV